MFLAVVLVGLSGAPANAATVRVHDGRDRVSAKIDIVSAAYTNGPRYLRFRVSVRDLQQAGEFRLQVAAAGGTDEWNFLAVTRKGVRFLKTGNFGTHRTRCRGDRATWSPARNVIHARIPHRCVKQASDHTRLAMWASSRFLTGSNAQDRSPTRAVRRG